MKSTHSRRLTAAVLLFAAAASAQSLDSTFAHLDALSKGFRGMTADVKQISFTAFSKDTDEKSGRISMFRAGSQDSRWLVEFTQPEERAVGYAKNKAQMYYPKTNTVQEYNLGKESRLVDQFMMLGFGTPSADLRKSYNVKYVETTNIDGAPADHIFLEPKSPEVKDHVRGIDLWVAAGGYPVRMKVLQPSKDTMEFQYSNVKINPPSLTEASVRLKLPKGVKKETPQR